MVISVAEIFISVLAVVISIITLHRSAAQFKIAQIVVRQQFLYDRRIEVYSIARQIMAALQTYELQIKQLIDVLDSSVFDTKDLFAGLCNISCMSNAQMATNLADTEAQRIYGDKIAHLRLLAESVSVLFDFGVEHRQLICMFEDIIFDYTDALNGLRICFVCLNTSDKTGPVIHSLDGKSSLERLQIVVDQNKIRECLERLLSHIGEHNDMKKFVTLSMLIRNDLYAERKPWSFVKNKRKIGG